MRNNKSKKNFLTSLVSFLISIHSITAQVTDRDRPTEWNQLIPGARFIDRFLPMPKGTLSSNTWGGMNVLPRYINNGIEDNERSYWGGNIIKSDDGLYHLFVCGWPENSPKGHHTWPKSIVYHTICKNSIGPFIIKDTIGPGHNPEAFITKDGHYAIYVIDGYYLSDNIDGPWSYHKFDFDSRDRRIIEGLSNLTFAKREDGSNLMVCRGGGIWISETGLSTYNQLTDKRVYPPVDGEFEDPVVWRDNIQYNLIVNDWLGRIAFYLRSKDGVNWITDPGEAYLPGVISKHKDGKVEDWFKYERIKIFQDEYGRAIQANFAVIDTLKNEDKANDRHSSKNISIPLNPGLLMTMLNTEPIDSFTKTIKIRISAEKNFNPTKELDLSSIRFGASSEVNFGKGCKVIDTKNDGNNLIITFDASGNGMTDKEFAPKLIGKTKKGDMVYGYTQLPWIDYNPAILSARKPTFITDNGKNIVSFIVENFGLKVSSNAKWTLTLHDEGKDSIIGMGELTPISPYEKVDVKNESLFSPIKEKEYSFTLSINEKDNVSEYNFKSKY